MTVVRQSLSPELGGPVYRSSQPTVLRDRMSAVAVSHEVYPLTGRLDGLATGVHVGQVHLAFVRYGAPTRVVAEPTGDSVCWTLPLGPMRVDWDARRHDSYAGRGFVLNRDRETVMLPEPVRGAFVLTAPQESLRRQAARLTGRPCGELDISPGPTPREREGIIDPAWRHAAAVLARVPHPPPALLDQLEQSLLTSLVLELAAATGPEEAPVPRPPAHDHARRAEEWAREHLRTQWDVAAWASAVGLSVRHLQKCFHEVHECSPMTFVQRLRLEGAHHDLSAHPDRSVSAVAADWGFAHLGRFAALHRERYGVTPSGWRRELTGLSRA